MAYYGVSKPGVFMFLLVTVGLSASAIAAGLAERENRVYDVSGVQDEIETMAQRADRTLDFQEQAVCQLIDDVAFDLERVNTRTAFNIRQLGLGVVGGGGTDCSAPRGGRGHDARR